MITIWDMIVNSRYPDEDAYCYIGMFVFSLSILLSILIIPLVVYFLWDIVKPLLRRRALFRNDKHGLHQFLITLLLFIAVIILNVITVIMGIHGIYFLTQIKLNKNLVQEIQEGRDIYFAYIIPSSHQVLYFLEAALEAARENLLLWGFLFLANIICKLVAKNFHFKTFTTLLVVRVLFVFVCHYNIWELISNHIGDELAEISYSIIPFHTFTKLFRTFEIFLDILVYIPFVFYLRTLIKERLRVQEQRPQGQDTPLVFDTVTQTLCDKDEMVLIRKYMNIYSFLLVVEFIINLIESHVPNFIVKYSLSISTKQVIILEMVMAVVNQFLSLILPVLTIIFIIILINYIRKKGMSQSSHQQSYGTPGNTDELDDDGLDSDNERKKLSLRRVLVNSFLVITIALVITLFSSYLWYTPGNRAHIIMNPGDYILLHDNNTEKSSLGIFMSSCDVVTASLNVSAQFTMFNLNLLVTEADIYPKRCEESDSIIFHEKFSDTQEYTIQKKKPPIWDFHDYFNFYKWYPNGTYFDGFNANVSMTFKGTNYALPCYRDEYQLSGLVVTCDTANDSEISYMCDAAENTRCYVENTAVLRIEGTITGRLNYTKIYEINLNMPRYKGEGTNYSYTHIGDEDVKKFGLIEFLEIEKDQRYYCHIYLVCHYAAWKSVLLVLGLFFVLVLYLGLSLVCLSMTLFKNWNIP